MLGPHYWSRKRLRLGITFSNKVLFPQRLFWLPRTHPQNSLPILLPGFSLFGTWMYACLCAGPLASSEHAILCYRTGKAMVLTPATEELLLNLLIHTREKAYFPPLAFGLQPKATKSCWVSKTANWGTGELCNTRRFLKAGAGKSVSKVWKTEEKHAD